MAQTNLFSRLTQLFRSGPIVKRKVRNFKQPTASSAIEVFRRAHSDVYNNTLSAYGTFDRMSRYSDFAEMESTPEIASALDIYAEETVSPDEKGNVLHVYSENRKIHELLENLFYDTLNVEFNLVMWIRNLCKYGDFFLFNDVSPEFGVIAAYPISISEMEREEGFDPDDPAAVRFRWATQGNQMLENWQISHFRLLGNDAFLPYGSSVLESSRRIWRQLILIEDAMLVYRVIRAPERRVFYIDVGNVPPEDVSNYLEQAQTSLKRNQVVDGDNGKVDLRYNPMPIWKGTPIPLLDGRMVTIEELSREVTEGKECWVYSIQDDTHQIVPGKVTWCGKNYTAEKMIKVWLDDDTFVMTAPEHPFVMRDGTSKRADELTSGDSLMPLYRKMSSVEDGDWIKNYEKSYNPATEKFEYTHKLSADDKYHASGGYSVRARRVIHHVDYNKHNNEPTNLQEMSYTAHSKHHADHCQHTLNTPELLKLRSIRRIAYNKSNAKRKKTAEDNKKYQKAQRMGADYNGSALHKSHNKIRKEAQLRSWAENKENRSAAMRLVLPQECVDIAIDALQNNVSLNRDSLFEIISKTDKFIKAWQDANSQNNRKYEQYSPRTFACQIKEFGYTGFRDFKKQSISGYRNHKVNSIEVVFKPDDVYCMTVVGTQGENDRHNFAVSGIDRSGAYSNSGVFVQNSVDEDYFLPVRGGESGTRIDTLAGGQNTAAIEDVEYIQKKLFAALKIPRAYLGYDEDVGAKATLAQEDIRFSRSIQRIQKTVISELNKLAMIHLFCHGYEGDELVDFELKLSNPSTIAQQQKLELIRSRFEIAGTVPEGTVNRAWIQKNVLGLTDEEIEDVQIGRIQDKINDTEVEEAGTAETPDGGGGGDTGGDDDAGGLFAGDRAEGELLTSLPNSDDEDDDDNEEHAESDIVANLSIDDDDAPIKAHNAIMNAFGEPMKKSRKVHVGPASTHMPDFATMVSVGKSGRTQDSLNKPFDDDYAKSPFGESVNEPDASPPRLTYDLVKTLGRMSNQIGISKAALLSESDQEIDLEIND